MAEAANTPMGPEEIVELKDAIRQDQKRAATACGYLAISASTGKKFPEYPDSFLTWEEADLELEAHDITIVLTNAALIGMNVETSLHGDEPYWHVGQPPVQPEEFKTCFDLIHPTEEKESRG